MPQDPNAPILVLDSGLGGLTVARAIRQRLPGEKLLYFGDTARVPYGTKSALGITACVTQIVSYLRGYEPKHVVVACNSASAVALPALRDRFPDLPVTGVIEPGAKAAAKAAGERLHCTIAVIATDATVRSKAYERAVVRRRMKARLVQRATPLLVPMIEDGRDCRDPLVKLCLDEYLRPLTFYDPDVLVLGCTHYPMLRPGIERAMGEKCVVIDSAEACAADVAGRLESAGMLRSPLADVLDPQPSLRLFASDQSPKFAKIASRFLGERVESVKVVSPDRLHDAEEAARTLKLPIAPARRSA